MFHVVKNAICPFLFLSAEITACTSLLNNTFNCLCRAKWSIKSVWGRIHSYQNSSLEKLSVLFYGTCLLSKCHLALWESCIVTFQGNEQDMSHGYLVLFFHSFFLLLFILCTDLKYDGVLWFFFFFKALFNPRVTWMVNQC